MIDPFDPLSTPPLDKFDQWLELWEAQKRSPYWSVLSDAEKEACSREYWSGYWESLLSR